MNNDAIYQVFINQIDKVLVAFEDLMDDCPADFDEELAEIIARAHALTRNAYIHALANKEK